LNIKLNRALSDRLQVSRSTGKDLVAEVDFKFLRSLLLTKSGTIFNKRGTQKTCTHACIIIRTIHTVVTNRGLDSEDEVLGSTVIIRATDGKSENRNVLDV
jgi:hypothetical protein